MKDKDKYFVETENLAFPEIHTGKVKQISSEKPNADESVIYDTVAVPEIHIKKKKDKHSTFIIENLSYIRIMGM